MNNRQRFFVIVQLCLTFSLILWFFVQPFMGEYFSLRSRMMLYEYVLGTSTFLKNHKNQNEKLEKNAVRFEQLPLQEKRVITQDYQNLQRYVQRPALIKIEDGLKILFFHSPIFQLAWIFFSLILGIMLLLNKTGAPQASWLLPIIALCYGIDNYQNGKVPQSSVDMSLFPTEKQVIQEYSRDQGSKNIVSQNELKEAWNFYLVNHWTHESKASNEIQLQEKTLEEAEFNFTVARLMLLSSSQPSQWASTFQEKSNFWLLILYFIWNFYFAVSVQTPRPRRDI